MATDDERFGAFRGEPKAVWLTEANGDRRMRLSEAFGFTDADGTNWDAPKGYVVDGASIPRALWSLVGSPYTGDYRRASIVHDVACDHHPHDGPQRKAADQMFYAACRAGGCGNAQAKLLYLGVRIGSTWAGRTHKGLSQVEEIKLEPSPDDLALQEEFSRMGHQILAEDSVLVSTKALVSPQDEASAAVAQVNAVLAASGT